MLDLGCGTGWAVRFAASSANWRGEFYGIDISSRMIEKAQAGVADHKNVHFRKANAEKLPFDNAFFDIVICCNSFHHYFSPSNVLSEVYRVLRPNGKFYVLDITADGIPTRILDWLAKKREPAHVKFYSTREFRKFFGEAGLQYLTSKPIVLSAKVHITQKQLDAATQSSS